MSTCTRLAPSTPIVAMMRPSRPAISHNAATGLAERVIRQIGDEAGTKADHADQAADDNDRNIPGEGGINSGGREYLCGRAAALRRAG
jgi:hypothetical protein